MKKTYVVDDFVSHNESNVALGIAVGFELVLSAQSSDFDVFCDHSKPTHIFDRNVLTLLRAVVTGRICNVPD